MHVYDEGQIAAVLQEYCYLTPKPSFDGARSDRLSEKLREEILLAHAPPPPPLVGSQQLLQRVNLKALLAAATLDDDVQRLKSEFLAMRIRVKCYTHEAAASTSPGIELSSS